MKKTEESFNFKKQITPYFRYGKDDYYRIFGIDKNSASCEQLFFTTSKKKRPKFINKKIEIPAKSWINTNSFRNTLYLETLLQFTNINSIDLMFEYQGKMRIKVWQARKELPDNLLKEVVVCSTERTHYLINLGTVADLGHESRVFWQIDSLATGVTLYDASYISKTSPKECRLAVLLRTFGRTEDIKAILKNFTEVAEKNPYYATLLESINFWVLDTTQGCEQSYTETWQQQLNLKILTAPNLGGGGNAGHLLALFQEACQTSNNPPTEVLIMDDDLIISIESLARYFMFCAYKQQDIICSVPILMKSRPTVIWEDGGFWGRQNFDDSNRSLFPTLVKHGLNVTGTTRNKEKNIERFSALNICEYSTFIFFGLSANILEKLGYPVALFLRGDDIEFSLRAYKLEIPLITNPNLAAWHEPAHSYGQEYMAIMHGIIINMAYSNEPVESYVNFLQERLFEHISIDDEAGLSVYSTLLKDIIDLQSPILTNHFQKHYIARLKMFAEIKMIELSHSDYSEFEKTAKANKMLLIPFVHPGYYHNVGKNFNGIVVLNQSLHSYREVPHLTAAKKNQLIENYVKLLSEFTLRFAEIQLHWQTRLQETGKKCYWSAIKKQYTMDTEIIFQNQKSICEEIELFKFEDILGQEQTESKMSILARRLIEKSSICADKVQIIPLKTLKRKSKITMKLDLPADFDADAYLQINEDVADAEIDPVEHYLKYGRKEGRKYWN